MTEPAADLARIAAALGAARPELPAAAIRALAEAEHRRLTQPPLALPEEWGGRDGPEPIRYGDYERRGICVDF